MSALAWVLAVGAVWRLTLLIVADELTAPLRDAVLDRWRGERLIVLLSCAWCSSMWVAPAVIASGLAWGDGWGWQLAAGTLSASAVTGWLSSFAAPDG